MSTLQQFLGGGGGGGEGPRNACKMFTSSSGSRSNDNSGTDTAAITWTVPSNFDVSVALRVYVWGAGGCGGLSGGSGSCYGGGGGGLAISEITSLTPGDTVAVTVGAGCRSYNGVGGTSSFGSFLSATGGNAGDNSSSNQGVSTYGAGGMGLNGNIANRRGGYGGNGNNSSSSGYGGGGGSAPSPDGDKDGYKGGNGTSYSGGGGASINYHGTNAYTSYTSVGGAGTAGYGAAPKAALLTTAMALPVALAFLELAGMAHLPTHTPTTQSERPRQATAKVTQSGRQTSSSWAAAAAGRAVPLAKVLNRPHVAAVAAAPVLAAVAATLTKAATTSPT